MLRFFQKKEEAPAPKALARGQCPTCGRISGLKYCPADGTLLHEPYEPVGKELAAYKRPGSTSPLLCEGCRIYNVQDSKFCEYCGRALRAAS